MLPLADELGHHEARLNRLSQPDLVGQHAAAAGERVDGEYRCLQLVRVQVDLGLSHGSHHPRLPVGHLASQLPRHQPLMEAGKGTDHWRWARDELRRDSRQLRHQASYSDTRGPPVKSEFSRADLPPWARSEEGSLRWRQGGCV